MSCVRVRELCVCERRREDTAGGGGVGGGGGDGSAQPKARIPRKDVGKKS